MSLKSFLQMQEGGQTFVSPFAQPDPTGTTKAVTPRQRPNLTFEAVTGINRKATSPTITIGDQPDITQTPKEKEPEIFDPGVSTISSFGYTAQSPEVIAASTALGIPLTGFEDGAFYDSLVAMNQPETPLSRGLDKFLGPVLPITPKGTLGASLGLVPFVGPAALTTQRALSGEPIFGTSKEATPATTPKATTTTTTPIATKVTTAPLGYTYPGGGFGATVTPAAPAAPAATTPIATTVTTAPVGPSGSAVRAAIEAASARQGSIAAGEAMLGSAPAATPVSVGQDIFGPAYGQGGDISPDFAIGGSGSFTSFSHYGAGVSQADEANIISTGINSGVFSDSQSGRDAIDAMIDSGYTESAITAVASGMGTEGQPDYDVGGVSVSAPSKVICQELYDQGLLEHSIYSLDEQFGEYLRKHDLALLKGYHAWAYNVVNAMRKSKTITHIVRIVSRPVVKHIAYKMGYPSKTLLGAAMFNVGAFICRRLAKKEIVYA